MICSGAVGAIAFSSETIVEVPAEQETIELEAIGLTLILPDSWEGKYGVEMDADGAGCAVIRLLSGGLPRQAVFADRASVTDRRDQMP